MKQQREYIFLTGFMGSGKSTLGKKLATHLQYNFIDLDHYIEHREQKTISFIFENEGEAVFRNLETNCLKEILTLDQPSVIALGGGTVCFANNLELALSNGLLIYIELPASVLADRLKHGLQKRPLLKNVAPEDFLKNISEKLQERELWYRQAHISLSGLNLTPKILQQKILDYKKDHNAL